MPDSHLQARATREAEDTPIAALDVSRVDRFQANTHWPCFTRLRREEPVHFCPESVHGAYWSVTRLDDILAVETNHRQFSSERNVIIGDVPATFDATRAFATADPPEHTRERKAVTPAMSPQRVAILEARTRANIGAVLDGLPLDETFDWVERVSVELTTQMVAMLFDFPWEERRLLPYWSEVLVTTPQVGAITTTAVERDAIVNEYRSRILEMWRARAGESPGDDIISALAHNPDTAGMIEDPSHLIGTVSLVAGANEASRGALSGSIVAFNQFPGEWERLRADPSLASNAAAEIVRWQTPISHMRRTAVEDVEFRGRLIRRGDRVVMWYCSGNRDEAYFEDGDALRIARPNARRHVAFGGGIHRCLGSHVAEMQLRVLLEEILKRFTLVELAAEPRRKASNFSAGFDQVLVRIPS
ncbi:MAG: cytochrome P450 [Vicinamibacterales bacterium]